jgi:glyoxylase-like metal-dependent hydrolase (beta-lactamase superfamily II)
MLDVRQRPAARWREIDALERALRWPGADPRAALVLANGLIAARQDERGRDGFRELAAEHPDRPLYLALASLFTARAARRLPPEEALAAVEEAIAGLDRAVARDPGVTTYLRGQVLAELPAGFGRAEAAVADLEWVQANRDRFPPGLQRGVLRSLARAYTALGREEDARRALERSGQASLDGDEPVIVADYWLTVRDGFHFGPPRLRELAPGVLVAQGYDFADFAFVSTGAGLVAIDAGTTPGNVRAALAALREVTDQPITHVILTHAHWDHIGGLEALAGQGTEVIAQARFPEELALVHATAAPNSDFFGADVTPLPDVRPDRLVAAPETLTVGGVELALYPVAGGETVDGLLVHLPDRGLLFAGDVLMPYLGAPFLPEGSAEGLFETIELIRRLAPRMLVQGHTGLTELFTVETLPGYEAALRELHALVLEGVRTGEGLTAILERNHLPELLREHPTAVIPYLVTRDNLIDRVHRQRTGYWQPGWEGVEHVSDREWAAALDLLAGGREEAFATAAGALLEDAAYPVALRLADLGLAAHPESQTLAGVRRRALDRLRERHQQLNPFKFIVYSSLAGAELPPVE